MAREITVERDGNVYLISLGNKQKIETTWAEEESDLKEWLIQIQKMYGKKHKGPLFVGLSTERSTNYACGSSWYAGHHNLLQLCVGNYCMLWELRTNGKNQPKQLRDFLYSSQTTIVGVGINRVVEQLQEETNLMITNVVELRTLAEEKLGASTKGQFAKYKVENLAKVVLGDEVVEVIRPTKIPWEVKVPSALYWNWWDWVLSDDLVKFTSLEVFFAAKMGSKLSLKV